MNEELINSIADKHLELYSQESAYREDLRRQIKYLEYLLDRSFHRPIYKELYKEEYGDFSEYCNLVAKELRSRHTH